MKRLVVLAAALVLSSCAGGATGDPPRTASTFEPEVAEAPTDTPLKEFCDAWASGQVVGEDPVASLEEWARLMIETGTPADFTDTARKGFIVYIASLLDFPEVAISPTSLMRPTFTEDEQLYIDEMRLYTSDNCEAEILAVQESLDANEPSDLSTAEE